MHAATCIRPTGLYNSVAYYYTVIWNSVALCNIHDTGMGETKHHSMLMNSGVFTMGETRCRGLGDEARSLPEGNTVLLMNYERLNFDVLEEKLN